jgi:hypothetical protein
LHARVKRASKLHERNQAQFSFLLQKAWSLQDILSNQKSSEHKFQSSFLRFAEDKYKDIKLKLIWWYYVIIRPFLMRFLSIVCAIASIIVIWSETVFRFENPILSIPALILQNPEISYGTLAFVSMGIILYMCTCAYSTLFKVRFFDYKLVPRHQTDEGSILFVGAYLCRLTFPLCYNFLNMASDTEDSIFIEVSGQRIFD